jgi:hypothetical protein
VAPAATRITAHVAEREPYPALLELGQRLKKSCAAWPAAARAVAAAKPAALETALVALLNARARALGELWFWCDVEPLFGWAEHKENAGPVADAIAKLLRADNPSRVGRIEQLKKTPEVRALLELLAARRAVLAALPVLLSPPHFPNLGKWLIPPAGVAVGPWPALPWAFVIVYNARNGTTETPPPGYRVEPASLPFDVLRLALATAYPMDSSRVRELLIAGLRNSPDPTNVPTRNPLQVFDRVLYCPNSWKV